MTRSRAILASLCLLGIASGAFAVASDPGPRTWPASTRDRLSLEAINARGIELARARKQLDEAEHQNRADYEAVIAEIRSSLSGLAPTTVIGYDPNRPGPDGSRGCFYEITSSTVTAPTATR